MKRKFAPFAKQFTTREIALVLSLSTVLCGCNHQDDQVVGRQPDDKAITAPAAVSPAKDAAPAMQPTGEAKPASSAGIESVNVQTGAKNEPPKPESSHTPTEAELKLAAVHIKQVWQHQVPAESLTEFERETYADIYYRKLPKDRQRNWDKFLSQPALAQSGETRMIPVSLPGLPTSGAQH